MVGMSWQSGLRFRLAGFSVDIPLNTLFGVGLIAWLWLPSFSGATAAHRWTSAIIFAVALLASVLLHELAHAVAARRFGFPVIGITLWAFGGFTSYRPVRNTPAREAAIAAAGPASTFVVAAAAWLVWRQLPGDSTALAEIIGAVALANAVVAVFNMLPALPLDGGSILASGIWAVTGSSAKGHRVAAYAGMVLAGLLVALPLLLTLRSGGQVDVGFLGVSILVAVFLFFGARSALEQADLHADLDGRTARDLASPVVVVPAAATLAALDEFMAGVADPGRIVALVGGPESGLQGFVLPPAAAAVPAPQRASTPVSAVTRSVAQWRALPAEAPAAQAMAMLQEAGGPVVVLDERNRPFGVIIGGSSSL